MFTIQQNRRLRDKDYMCIKKIQLTDKDRGEYLDLEDSINPNRCVVPDEQVGA